MSEVETLDELWDVAKKLPPPIRGQIADVSVLPESVQRYFRYAIAPGTAPASTVRLRMHGEIKLAGWHPFVAEQVICSTLGMIWQAKVSMFGLSISGSDRLLGGNGSMRWKLFGIIPLMHADGSDITRSSAGRMNIELLWLSSALSASSVKWTSSDANCITAQFEANGEQAAPQFLMDDSGALKSVSMLRWGQSR